MENMVVYLDGSMLDGPCGDTAVFGWAFAVTVEDKLVALARGSPPQHVRSIPATEAWALAGATRLLGSAARYMTDCKAVSQGGEKTCHCCWAGKCQDMDSDIHQHRWRQPGGGVDACPHARNGNRQHADRRWQYADESAVGVQQDG